MSTLVFKNKSPNFTPLSNVFIDKYMPKARGEFIKVYILGLKYCTSGEPGVNSAILAEKLNLLESDVMNAWSYFQEEGLVNLTSVDTKGNYSIEFLDIVHEESLNNSSVNLLDEIKNNSTRGMLEEIESLLARPLSSKEMETYLSWQKDFDFSPEIILLLIMYCVNKKKTDYRYMEKVALSWKDQNIKTVDEAQSLIKQGEDKWVKYRKVLTYMGIKDKEVMKPQENLLEKWIINFEMPVDMIYKACDICFERINKMDFKYIDAVISNWKKDNIKSVSEIATSDKKIYPKKNKTYNNNNNTTTSNQSKKRSFNDFEQRSYDFDDLERKLLGWDND